MSSADRPLPDDPFDRVIRRAAGRYLGPGPCPDAAELAALVEGTVSAKERTALETHASGCSRCSAQLAILARLPTDDSRPLAAAPESSRRPWRWRWAIPLATAVVVFAVWSEARRELMRAPMRLPETPAVRSDGQAPGRSLPSQSPPAETVVLGEGAKADAPPAAARPEPTMSDRNEAPIVGGARARQSEREDAVAEQSVGREAFATAADSAAANSADTGSAAAKAPPPASDERKQERQSSSSGDAAARSDRREVAPQAASESFRDQAEADGHSAEADRQKPAAEPAPSSPALPAPLRKAAPSPSAAKVAGIAGPLVIRASDTVWVRVDGAAIERTTDAGRTWRTERRLELQAIANGVCLSVDVCWLAGAHGLVLRREPSGQWADVSPSAAGRIDRIEATDASHATLTTTDGARLITTDGGRTWSPAR
jgi:hypothetical protein